MFTPMEEDREAGVAAGVLAVVEGAHQAGDRGLEPARPDRDEDRADREARDRGDEAQRHVAGHDEDAAEEHRPLGPEEPVGHPSAQDGEQVDGTAVGAHDARGRGAVDAQSAVGRGDVHGQQDDALHAVEGEAPPQLDAEQVRQHAGLAEEEPVTGTGEVRAGKVVVVVARVWVLVAPSTARGVREVMRSLIYLPTG